VQTDCEKEEKKKARGRGGWGPGILWVELRGEGKDNRREKTGAQRRPGGGAREQVTVDGRPMSSGLQLCVHRRAPEFIFVIAASTPTPTSDSAANFIKDITPMITLERAGAWMNMILLSFFPLPAAPPSRKFFLFLTIFLSCFGFFVSRRLLSLLFVVL
jgi:hypothetical protein